MRQLVLNQILEYYDIPQILVATDATGMRYLCTLYAQSETEGYKYIGVQISEPRLMAFTGGQLDLRDAYLHPEVENAVYEVRAKNETLNAIAPIPQQEMAEDMLPDAGYFLDSAEYQN